MHVFRSSLAVAVFGAIALVASAASADSKTTSVSSYDYDGRGRIRSEEVKTYGEDAVLMGTAQARTSYDGDTGHVLEQSWTYRNAAGDVTASSLFTNDWREGQVVRSERTWMDATGRQTRREVDTWVREEAIRLRQRQTDVYDADDLLTENRYGIYTFDARGRSTGQDESRYDARGLQTGRQLVETTYDDLGHIDVRTTTEFDDEDEIAKVVEETWTWGREGHLNRIDTKVLDGARALLEKRVEQRENDAKGRMTKRTMTILDPAGEPLRRLIESLTYDDAGRLQARRGTWESFTVEP